jgi:hypothetical protein
VDVRAVSCFRCVFRDVCEWADLGYALYSAGGGGAYEGGEVRSECMAASAVSAVCMVECVGRVLRNVSAM